MKRFLILIIFSVYLIINNAFSEPSIANIEKKVTYYNNKYGIKCLSEKITDNFGNGYPALYGTRNMRPVLYGIVYRGGANNFYHKDNKRDNSNPLPEDGLINLSNEGFKKAIYLYDKNFDQAPKEIINPTIDDTLRYLRITGTDRKSIKKIISQVYEVIKNPESGPIYMHCWNGWHQSGLMSSAILMQFCDFTNSQALDYWMKNTDKNNKGYDHIKKIIKEHERFDEFKIDKKIKSLICPCNK
jgi:hypothetical protein